MVFTRFMAFVSFFVGYASVIGVYYGVTLPWITITENIPEIKRSIVVSKMGPLKILFEIPTIGYMKEYTPQSFAEDIFVKKAAKITNLSASLEALSFYSTLVFDASVPSVFLCITVGTLSILALCKSSGEIPSDILFCGRLATLSSLILLISGTLYMYHIRKAGQDVIKAVSELSEIFAEKLEKNTDVEINNGLLVYVGTGFILFLVSLIILSCCRRRYRTVPLQIARERLLVD